MAREERGDLERAEKGFKGGREFRIAQKEAIWSIYNHMCCDLE